MKPEWLRPGFEFVSPCPFSTVTPQASSLGSLRYSLLLESAPGIRARYAWLFNQSVCHSRSMIDLRLNGHRLQPSHFQVGAEIIDRSRTGLVQAMSRHSCRTHIPISESMSFQGHLVDFALSETLTNIV